MPGVCFSSFLPSRARAGRTALVALAALCSSPTAIAQWSGNPKRNTLAAAPCLPPQQPMAEYLALDPVLVPCDDGCFYAWIDPSGRVNVQVLDACGHQALSMPYMVPGTSSVGGPWPFFTQLAGCAYANGDGARNQLFLTYTVWSGLLQRNELRGQCFEFTTPGGVPTLTPGSTVSLCTSALPHSLITPVTDRSYDTTNLNDVVGAVWGCREWDFVLGTSTMTVGNVTGPFATPAWCGAVVDSFTLPAAATPTRLSVLSDDAGGAYGAWRGWNGTNYYYQGTRLNAACGVFSMAWPTTQAATTRTSDDWVVARDLAGGLFVAWREDPGGATEQLFTCHVTGANVWSNLRPAATVPGGRLLAPLAMASMPSTTRQRAALLYRADTSILVRELDWAANTLASAWSTSVGAIAGTADARGCATLGSKGVVVGWIGDFAVGSTTRLYGQEVDFAGSKLWNKSNPLEVSVNLSAEDKFVPMVVRKYSLPEVIYGWVDTRTVANSPGATIPGGYVQSVADDFLPFPWAGFKRQDGKLGSSMHCFALIQAFSIHDQVFALGTQEGSALGAELYAQDSIDDAFVLVRDMNPGSIGAVPGRAFACGNRRVFSATSSVGGSEPWVTDGTPAGTMQLADCAPGTPGSSPQLLGVIPGSMPPRLLFAAGSSASGRELWRTDGTPAETVQVLDLRPGSGSGVVSANPVWLGSHLYFWGNEGVHGIELWRTDGTAAGTTLVADMSPGSASTSPGDLFVLGDKLLVVGGLAGIGSEPHVFDPATNTMTLLGDLAPGAASSGASFAVEAAGVAWFSANDGTAGRELWCTDGTPAGTRMVRDIHPTGSSDPREFAVAGGNVLFRADDGVHGDELWRSDGTAAGTMLVADVEPGPGGSNLVKITPVGGGRCLFTATSAGVGREPWVTDGTAAGTGLLADVNPGNAGSNPNHYDVVAGSVYFDAIVDSEPRTIRLALEAPATYGQGCAGSGVPTIGAPTGSARIGQTFTVSLRGAAPGSLTFLALNVTGAPTIVGQCALYVGLPVLDAFAAFTDGAGDAAVVLNVPNDPALVGLDTFWQWVVVDPAGPLLGAFSLSDAMRATIDR